MLNKHAAKKLNRHAADRIEGIRHLLCDLPLSAYTQDGAIHPVDTEVQLKESGVPGTGGQVPAVCPVLILLQASLHDVTRLCVKDWRCQLHAAGTGQQCMLALEDVR